VGAPKNDRASRRAGHTVPTGPLHLRSPRRIRTGSPRSIRVCAARLCQAFGLTTRPSRKSRMSTFLWRVGRASSRAEWYRRRLRRRRSSGLRKSSWNTRLLQAEGSTLGARGRSCGQSGVSDPKGRKGSDSSRWSHRPSKDPNGGQRTSPTALMRQRGVVNPSAVARFVARYSRRCCGGSRSSPQISISALSSITRSAGMRKNSAGRVATRTSPT